MVVYVYFDLVFFIFWVMECDFECLVGLFGVCRRVLILVVRFGGDIDVVVELIDDEFEFF